MEEQSFYKTTKRRELTSTYMVTPTGESRATSYTRYSPDLRVLEQMETSKGANGTTVEQSTYKYDSLYQLERASTENAFGSMMRDEAFAYDGLGNTRSVDDVLGSLDSTITTRGDDLDRVCRTEPKPTGTSGSIGVGTVGGIAGGGVATSDGQTRLWLEAESSQMTAPMRFATDPDASLGAYIEVPAGSGNNVGSATLSVSVPSSGTYFLWLRVRAASTADDSYTISLNGKSLTWNAGTASSWTWKRVNVVSGFLLQPAAFYLSKGKTTLTIGAREDGVKVNRVLVTTDAFTNPSTIEPSATPTNVVVEAESGSHEAPWGLEIDGATSAGAYLTVPKGHPNQGSPDNAPKATVQFEVPSDGYYAVWARVLAPDSYTNSFFLKVDNESWWTWHIPISTAWQTRRVYNHDGSSNQPVTVWLKAGAHTLTLAQRESGTGIDTIIVTNQFGTNAPTTTTAPAPDDCQYRYDAQGNAVTVASNSGATRNFQYDLHGRVKSLVSGTAIGTYRYGPEGEVMSYVQGGTGADNRSETHYGPFTRSYFTRGGRSVQLIERQHSRRAHRSPRDRPECDCPLWSWRQPRAPARNGSDRKDHAGDQLSCLRRHRRGHGPARWGRLPVGALRQRRSPRRIRRRTHGCAPLRPARSLPATRSLIIPRSTTMMNPYAFAWNDPINFADPSGMDPAASGVHLRQSARRCLVEHRGASPCVRLGLSAGRCSES